MMTREQMQDFVRSLGLDPFDVQEIRMTYDGIDVVTLKEHDGARYAEFLIEGQWIPGYELPSQLLFADVQTRIATETRHFEYADQEVAV